MFKNALVIIFLLTSFFYSNAQQTDYYVKKGFAIAGYDITSYFEDAPQEGSNEFVYEFDGTKFKFVSQENLEKFKANPEEFLPQYGGYCAYAIAYKGKKYKVNPETYEIRDGKLYLFYNAGRNNTLEKWIAEDPEKLRGLADAAWTKVKYKKSK